MFLSSGPKSFCITFHADSIRWALVAVSPLRGSIVQNTTELFPLRDDDASTYCPPTTNGARSLMRTMYRASISSPSFFAPTFVPRDNTKKLAGIRIVTRVLSGRVGNGDSAWSGGCRTANQPLKPRLKVFELKVI